MVNVIWYHTVQHTTFWYKLPLWYPDSWTAAIAQLVRILARYEEVPGSSPAHVTEQVRRQTIQSLWRKSSASGANTGQPGQTLVGKTRWVKQKTRNTIVWYKLASWYPDSHPARGPAGQPEGQPASKQIVSLYVLFHVIYIYIYIYIHVCVLPYIVICCIHVLYVAKRSDKIRPPKPAGQLAGRGKLPG